MGEQRRTGTELGRALGVAHTSFSRRVTGEVEFGVSEVETLAQVFGVTEAYLYGFTDTRSAEPRPEALSIFDPRPATPTRREVITKSGVVDLARYRTLRPERRPGGRLPHQAPAPPVRPAQRPLWPVQSERAS